MDEKLGAAQTQARSHGLLLMQQKAVVSTEYAHAHDEALAAA